MPEALGDPWPLFEMGLRSDLLFGEAHPARVRLGPALDLRTEGFRTFEIAGGLALLLPVESGFAFTVTGGAGWGARPEGRDGALALGQLAFRVAPLQLLQRVRVGREPLRGGARAAPRAARLGDHHRARIRSSNSSS
ncbi:MAG: hypothetical protein M5U28_50865 [Sandaracinaceae bacterium]|nr:hypothetical protein [Sandaracinaceae bacterium]